MYQYARRNELFVQHIIYTRYILYITIIILYHASCHHIIVSCTWYLLVTISFRWSLCFSFFGAKIDFNTSTASGVAFRLLQLHKKNVTSRPKITPPKRNLNIALIPVYRCRHQVFIPAIKTRGCSQSVMQNTFDTIYRKFDVSIFRYFDIGKFRYDIHYHCDKYYLVGST